MKHQSVILSTKDLVNYSRKLSTNTLTFAVHVAQANIGFLTGTVHKLVLIIIDRIVLTFAVHVTQGSRAHIAQADGALTGTVHKLVAVPGVELGRRYHFGQLLHV